MRLTGSSGIWRALCDMDIGPDTGPYTDHNITITTIIVDPDKSEVAMITPYVQIARLIADSFHHLYHQLNRER